MPHHHHPPSPPNPPRPPRPPDPEEVTELWILLEILRTLRQSVEYQEEILEVQKQILEIITPPPAPPNSTSLLISLVIGVTTMQQFDPGATGIILQAAFLPAKSTAPNPGFTVKWTDSNGFCTFANDASDPTGLTQDVTVGANATVGTAGVISAELTGQFPDGTTASLTGDFNYTIGAAPSNNATSLGITQIA